MGNSSDKPYASASGHAVPSDAGTGTSSPGRSPYSVGEIVIARHNGLLYEAKVEKIEFHGNLKFFIHYRGWKKYWDEWVGLDRLMECTAENLAKTSLPDKKYRVDKILNAGHISQIRAEKQVGGSAKKRLGDTPDTIHKKRGKHAKVNDPKPLKTRRIISMTPVLNQQLAFDFQFVRDGKLVILPRSPNVDEILKMYRDYRKEQDGGGISESIEEILTGLQTYFDKALPVLLLYNKERRQYEKATADNVPPSKLYGAEHMVRLFTKLPELLDNLNVKNRTVIQLKLKLQELLRFIQMNRDTFFLKSYDLPENSDPPLEYIESMKAKSLMHAV